MWVSVGVLFGPRGMEKPHAGVPRAGGMEEVHLGVAPPGVISGPLLATAVLEVLIGALVEAPPYCCLPRVVVVPEGVVRAVVPVQGRRVRHHQATCVAVSRPGGAQHDDIAWGGLQLHVGRPGALDGVVKPHLQNGQSPGYAIDPVAPRGVANSGTG